MDATTARRIAAEQTALYDRVMAERERADTYTLPELADAIGTDNAIERAMPAPCETCGRNPALEGPPVDGACHRMVLTPRLAVSE